MRKIYENAEIEIIVMNGEDVLTSSLGDHGNVGDLGGLE